METINNIAGAASKAIWGDGNANSSVEPRSGEMGAGTVNEPFDKGNQENIPKIESTSAASETGNPASAQQPNEERGPEDVDAVKETKESTERTQDQKDNKPKVPHTDEEREKAMETGDFPRDPNDHSGEPLKMHDDTQVPKDRRDSVAQEGGGPHGKTLGTGEKYVKSSGLQVDGGDFDATKPGAGIEATRLLEEKGIHKDVGAAGPAADDKSSGKSTDSPSPSEKRSKMAKLKEKLHIKH